MANTKEVKVIHGEGEEVAVVRLTENGRVEVVHDGEVSSLKNTSFDEAVGMFQTCGWEVKEDKVKEVAMKNNVPLSVQKEVDEYLALHAQKAELEAKMDKLKKNIRNYMENNNIKEISGSKGKKVYLQEAAASNSTAIYTNYEVEPIMKALGDAELVRQVTEVRVNSEKLEALLKLGKLPKDTVEKVKALKVVKQGTPRFSVKK